MAELKPIWYAGHPDGTVTVVDGTNQYVLPHLVKHSPTGFSWGYEGSGPAELARCLLVHALDVDAKCKACEGTGQLVWVDAADRYMPVAEAEADYTDWDPNTTITCCDCEDGIGVPPAMYQQFKRDVIAKLPGGHGTGDWTPWTMPQSDILNWHRRYLLRAVPS